MELSDPKEDKRTIQEVKNISFSTLDLGKSQVVL
jgi:hypothetical protein